MVIRVRLRTIIPYRCYILLHAYRADRRNVKKCIYFFKTLLKNGREHFGRVFRRVPTTNVTDVVRVTSNGASKARVGRRTNTYTLFVVFIRRVQYACLARACVQYVNKHIYRGDVTCRTRREHRFCMYSCFTRVYGVSHGRWTKETKPAMLFSDVRKKTRIDNLTARQSHKRVQMKGGGVSYYSSDPKTNSHLRTNFLIVFFYHSEISSRCTSCTITL